MRFSHKSLSLQRLMYGKKVIKREQEICRRPYTRRIQVCKLKRRPIRYAFRKSSNEFKIRFRMNPVSVLRFLLREELYGQLGRKGGIDVETLFKRCSAHFVVTQLQSADVIWRFHKELPTCSAKLRHKPQAKCVCLLFHIFRERSRTESIFLQHFENELQEMPRNASIVVFSLSYK